MRAAGRGWWGRVLVGLALVVLAGGAVMVGSPPRVIAPTAAVPVVRADPLDDLLAWLPVTDGTRAAFAVWDPRLDESPRATPDAAPDDSGTDATRGATPGVRTDAIRPGPATVDRDPADLGIEPRPRTLGLTAEWRSGHGWDVTDVSAWAAAGAAPGDLAILDGRFDVATIRAALLGIGYRESAHRGSPVFVLADQPTAGPTAGGDAATAANAVAVVGNRLVTAMDPTLVRAAIDAATGTAPALADLPAVAGLRRTLGPVTGFAVTDAATLARRCMGLPGNPVPPSDRLVAVAHGRTGPGGERRTLVAVTFAGEAAADAAAVVFAAGWPDATVALGLVTAPIDAYAEAGPVGRSGATVVGELLRGRVRGWAPVAVRLAGPVCEMVRDAHVPDPIEATPAPVAADRLRAALAVLPDLGPAGRVAFADVAGLAGAGGVAAPAGLEPDADATSDWLAGLGPLPGLAGLLPAESMTLWPATFGIGLDRIDLVAEARTDRPEETVAVIVARFDPVSVAKALDDAGYDRTIRDGVGQWALPEAAAARDEGPARRAGGPLWDNVALFSGMLVLSPSTVALRAALAGARPFTIGSEVAPAGIGRALVALPDVAAGVVTGGEFARVACADSGSGTITGTWDALATLRTGTAATAPTTLLALPGSGRSVREVAESLRRGIVGTRTEVGPGGTPVTGDGGASLTSVVRAGEAMVVPLPGGGQGVTVTLTPANPGGPAPDTFGPTDPPCQFGD